MSKNPCCGRKQKGLSIVEIMVAVTISLILLAGVSQIFLSSKTAYNVQDGMGRLQENARFALDVLARNVGMAGYTPSVVAINSFNSANSLENSVENATLGFTQAAGTASDTIEVNYVSNTDCLGNATGGTATDRFFLAGTNLMCLGNGNATPGVLAEGVENMQILYGEDIDGDGTANSYVGAGNVVDWNAVASVRIALLISTNRSVGATDNNTYTLLNTPPVGPIGDNVLRRVFTRTILLRNRG